MSGSVESRVNNAASAGGGGSGTVTSITLADDGSSASTPIFSITGTNPVTTSGTVSVGLAAQTANTVLAGGTVPAFRALVGADLPNPSATTLGGVKSLAVVSSKWINTISTAGAPAATQPAFTDISGSVAASQLPNPSSSTLGGVQSVAAVTSNFLTSISTSGVPAKAQPAFSDISGTASLTTQVTGILPAANGGTGNGFTAVSGPASSTKTFTLPNASDTIACLGQVNAFTAQQSVTPLALTPGSTVAWNMNTGQNATLTPVQNFTLSNPTNIVAGSSGMLTITQDGTGTRVITWSSAYKFAGGTKVVLSTAASSVDEMAWYSPDGTNVHVSGLLAFS